MMRIALIVATAIALTQQPISRAIEIWSVDPIAVDIEWITIDAEGKPTVTARRQTAVGPPAPLEFQHAHDRYVRFSYKGASPRTYSTAELLSSKKLHVPDVLPGGELLLFSPDMAVRPIALEVTGPRVHTVSIDRTRHASLAGLPAGEYKVEPVYEGGLKGQPKIAKVAVAQSTLLFMPPEDVGAVRITAVNDVCGAATEAGINAFLIPQVAPEIKSPPNRARVFTAKPPRCDMIVAGLRPGDYEAFFRREGAGAGTRNFSVTAQTLARADITGPPVLVDGRVTFNGKPVPGAVVDFLPTLSATELTPVRGETKTDADGYYTIGLDAPGTYRAALRASRMGMLSSKTVEFAEGRQRHDITMVGGTIRVKVTGWDGRSQIGVATERVVRDGAKSTRSVGYSAMSKSEIVLEGLAFGEYTVGLAIGSRQGPDAAKGGQTVILTAARPEVTLTFDVSKK